MRAAQETRTGKARNLPGSRVAAAYETGMTGKGTGAAAGGKGGAMAGWLTEAGATARQVVGIISVRQTELTDGRTVEGYRCQVAGEIGREAGRAAGMSGRGGGRAFGRTTAGGGISRNAASPPESMTTARATGINESVS